MRHRNVHSFLIKIKIKTSSGDPDLRQRHLLSSQQRINERGVLIRELYGGDAGYGESVSGAHSERRFSALSCKKAECRQPVLGVSK